ncbi:nucleotidyltransferase domain-containing protein [uncultured Fretibacterium sp.]|uniref:nucleotidyltransferase family protein n=1 Tax=uncultured Fretibacterium sp. TaxID=1678694 RepID=UPI0026309796|nr:nucleotidyltransferase domain-containing protein [uncultured Fretibacterium sp.]
MIMEKNPMESDTSRKAIGEFVRRLRGAEGDNLLRVVLFGSLARGEACEDSDVDVFVLLKEYDRTGAEKAAIKDRIFAIASAVEDLNDRKVYISPLIRSEATYMKNRRASMIYYDIADEGILLYEKDA